MGVGMSASASVSVGVGVGGWLGFTLFCYFVVILSYFISFHFMLCYFFYFS